MFDKSLHSWEMDSELAHILITLLTLLLHIQSNYIIIHEP